MLATDFDQSYGFNKEESAKMLNESNAKKDMEIVRYFVDKLVSAKRKGMDVVLDYKGIAQAYEAFKSEIESWNLITNESIYNTLALVSENDLEGNIAVVAGIGHVLDVQKMDKEGKFKELHKKYNLVFVVPNFDWPIKEDLLAKHRKELESYFPVIESAKKYMEKTGRKSVRLNLRER